MDWHVYAWLNIPPTVKKFIIRCVAFHTADLINKLKRSGFLPMSAPSASTWDFLELLPRILIMFYASFSPEAKRVIYNLCPLVHGFQLPNKDDGNVIPRLLYKEVY